jgi:L-ascorbate metabolism protein UlaG (beta-lactamase superfamily)
MQITKFGHSCVLLDDGQTKILFDPGSYSPLRDDLHVDAIVITHVHQDHLDIGELHKVLKNGSPRIITNTSVQTELSKHEIVAEIVEDGGSVTVNTFTISGHGKDHALIHADVPVFQNTGYLINNEIFHPGDSLFLPSVPVKVLLLPVAAPWSKVSETIDFVRAVKPRICFPIHDGFLTKEGQGMFYMLAGLGYKNIDAQFIEPELNKPYDLA